MSNRPNTFDQADIAQALAYKLAKTMNVSYDKIVERCEDTVSALIGEIIEL